MDNIKKIHIGEAKCAADLGDGSERGEYVCQDEVIYKLGRPPRSISLMYCYYPHDSGFPGRASVVHARPDVKSAWDYPYEDYFPYRGGIGGDRSDEPFCFMRDIRRHGEDVTLTLTMDPFLEDDYIIAVAEDLKTFGRVFLRINHEATGDWFCFNKRASYKEVADFFVRASKLIHKHAPNVLTVICIDGAEHTDDKEMVKYEEFAETVREADVWSVDKYFALHWTWPFDIAEKGGPGFRRGSVRHTYDLIKRSFELFSQANGGAKKPMTMAELNADGDVTGPFDQAAMVKEFADILDDENADWFSAFSLYQFRDRGRLGLETEDPNNPAVGITQPLFHTYKEIINRPRFMPPVTEIAETVTLPVTLRYGHSEDAEGLAVTLHFEGNPVFCEAVFDEGDNANYMMEIHGKWFYKSPGTKIVDFMPAFYEKPLTAPCDMTLKIIAPPATGENDPSQGADWYKNYYFTVEKLPRIRLLFEPILPGEN